MQIRACYRLIKYPSFFVYKASIISRLLLNVQKNIKKRSSKSRSLKIYSKLVSDIKTFQTNNIYNYIKKTVLSEVAFKFQIFVFATSSRILSQK